MPPATAAPHDGSALESLREALVALLSILRHDERCPWLRAFEEAAAECVRLANQGTSEARRALASRVLACFGGAGSFSDYAPVRVSSSGNVAPIPGMHALDEAANEVHARALALCVVEASA